MILGIFLCGRRSPEELINILLVSLPVVTEPSRRQGLMTPLHPSLFKLLSALRLPVERHQCRLNMVMMIFIHRSVVEVFTKFVFSMIIMIHIAAIDSGEWADICCQVLSATEVADSEGHRSRTKRRVTDSLVMVTILFFVEV